MSLFLFIYSFGIVGIPGLHLGWCSSSLGSETVRLWVYSVKYLRGCHVLQSMSYDMSRVVRRWKHSCFGSVEIFSEWIVTSDSIYTETGNYWSRSLVVKTKPWLNPCAEDTARKCCSFRSNDKRYETHTKILADTQMLRTLWNNPRVVKRGNRKIAVKWK